MALKIASEKTQLALIGRDTEKLNEVEVLALKN
jgi:hypothetical protein